MLLLYVANCKLKKKLENSPCKNVRNPRHRITNNLKSVVKSSNSIDEDTKLTKPLYLKGPGTY